jgi:hypothetical protein
VSDDRDLRYVRAAYRYLLDCTMATYESACAVKRTPKHELDRLEAMICSSFEAMAGNLAALGERVSGDGISPRWEFGGRVTRVLSYIVKEGVTEGTRRYFMETRHGQARREQPDVP